MKIKNPGNTTTVTKTYFQRFKKVGFQFEI